MRGTGRVRCGGRAEERGGWKPPHGASARLNTYIATAEGWLYLACVMDLASRRIVGWSMRDRIKADLVRQALKSAYWQRKPAPGLIMHTDRGSQYAGDQHRKLIRDFRMLQSMSRKGNCWDCQSVRAGSKLDSEDLPERA